MPNSDGFSAYLQAVTAASKGKAMDIGALDEMQADLRTPAGGPAEGADGPRLRAATDVLLALVQLDPEESAFANTLGLILQDQGMLVEAAAYFLEAAKRAERRGIALSEDDQGWIDAWRRNASVCLSGAGHLLSAAVIAQTIADSEYRDQARAAVAAAVARASPPADLPAADDR